MPKMTFPGWVVLALLVPFFALLPGSAGAEPNWSGMLLVDRTSSIHAEAARERPALAYPIIIHVDETSRAFKDGFRSGDYIVGTPDKEVATVAELDTILEKGKTPLKVHSATGIRVIEYSPSPANDDVQAYLKIRSYIRLGKVKEGLDSINQIMKEHAKSPVVNFIGAFALGSIKERDKANQHLMATYRLAPDTLLARIVKKRLPRDLQVKVEEELSATASAKPETSASAPAAVPTATGTTQVADIYEQQTTEQQGSEDPQNEPAATVPASFDQKTFNAATLDEKIDLLRKEVAKNPQEESLRGALAQHLVKKAMLKKSRPYEELEPLLREAADICPNPFPVQYAWGDLLFKMKNYEAAIPHLDDAVKLNQDHLDSTMKLGFSLTFTLKYEEAISHFERARKKIPTDFPLLYYLATCHFEMKDYEKALETLEEAVKNAKTEGDTRFAAQLMTKIKERGASGEGSTKDENQRFIVQYAGDSQKDLGEMTMEILEEAYDQVCTDLMYKPDIKINVLFFRTEDFYKLNKMPQWAGAVAQGEKILVPLRQGYSDPKSIKGILAHEFTHIIINLRTGQRCPTWVHEGLAVYQENKAARDDANVMRGDYERCFREVIQEQKKVFPLMQITLDHKTQGSDISLSYVESYLAMRFLIERWNWQGVDEMLNALNQGSHIENAIEAATSRNMNDFQKEFFEWLAGVQ